jgi:3'(2'), 5'-bisphosphate nucleotidase
MMDPDVSAFADPASIDELTAIASRAAAAVLAVDPATATRRRKSDRTPVSAADEASDAIIAEGLARLFPQLPLVSEEANASHRLASGASFALIDPLDGTHEFLAGRDEYSVNIAIIVSGVPAIGVIAVPAYGLVWRGVVGRGAERLCLPPGTRPDDASEIRSIRTRAKPPGGFVATISRSHFDAESDAFLSRLPVAARVVCGSALKFCRVAEGSADLYVRLAPLSEWDVAAGHALVVAAGGTVLGRDGAPLSYGRPQAGFCVPGFTAWGDPEAARQVLGRAATL